MLGIDYESSDEEDVATVPQTTETTKKEPRPNVEPATEIIPKIALPEQQRNERTESEVQGPSVSLEPAVEGPPGENAQESPYTNTRALIQNLTLPTVPNFSIPASPPGSPPQRSTKKFAQFLDLKKKGQHFNQRLETSSVLRDPGHLQRLMEFAGVGEEEQYASTLSEETALPAAWPEHAYFDELAASQKRIRKALEEQNARKPRDAIAFVSAAKSESSTRATTPSGRGSDQSAAEGTDRYQSGKRKELEQRGGRNDYYSKNRQRSRSRSPKRRRSRSRDRR